MLHFYFYFKKTHFISVRFSDWDEAINVESSHRRKFNFLFISHKREKKYKTRNAHISVPYTFIDRVWHKGGTGYKNYLNPSFQLV